MKPAPLPPDERSRLETLRALNLLDTAPEERFDRLTRMARRMFGVPISLVSLIDSNRQWFKSNQGLDATETARDLSFCGHAILGDDVLLIPDASQDERFSDNPLVLDNPNIRFYAGCPLKILNGSKIGTLCIIDREPRQFSEDDLALLRDLAAMAEQEIAAVQLSTLDELTLISNRRGFMTLGQHSLNLAVRAGTGVTMVFFDLDGFKEINDSFGHAEGDKALVAFAERMRSVFRETDVFGRIGGDEFAVLLSDADDATLDLVLSRFAEAVGQYNASAKRGYHLAYSAGRVTHAGGKGSIETLLAEADALMYENKQGKR
ncbi:GGDEF domain-containing protein [Arenimonas alkanexedens]